MPRTPNHKRRRRPPFFHPVPLRVRRDGWTVDRQCAFLGHLYLTGCVATAARAVGMSRMSAYRLRQREEAASFASAWDMVLTPPGLGRIASEVDWRKVTDEDLFRRVETGFVAPLIHRGKVTGIRRKADNSALLRLLRRLDAGTAQMRPGALTMTQRFFKTPLSAFQIACWISPSHRPVRQRRRRYCPSSGPPR